MKNHNFSICTLLFLLRYLIKIITLLICMLVNCSLIVYMYRFFNGNENAFSTEPLKNDNPDLSLGFYHMQNVSIYCMFIAMYICYVSYLCVIMCGYCMYRNVF